MDKVALQTTNVAAENAAKLAELFPDVLTEVMDEEGNVHYGIDAEALRAHVGDIAEDKRERYQFTWPGKQRARAEAIRPIDKTMRPVPEESVNWDTTENLYIEGDNLDALKILRETYAGKIKMIYIDPPYNTGHDFVYNDSFARSAEEERAENSAFDEKGNVFDAMYRENNESNGRFHSDWCSMIYPRLVLARDLLCEGGYLFVSIDYNENFNMRSILNQIFGDKGFVGEIYWESKTKSQNTSTSFNKLQPKAEMILVYGKRSKMRFNLVKSGEKLYPHVDERGKYREHVLELMNANGVRGRSSMVFDITDGVSTVSPPEGRQWKLGQDQVATYQEAGDLFIRDGRVVIKMRPDYERSVTTEPFWGFFDKTIGTAESAKKELKAVSYTHLTLPTNSLV